MFMWRKNCWYLALVFLIILLSNLVVGIRLNEIELNPDGTDSGKEWIELYSSSQASLENYKIMNSNGKNMSFNASFSGYYVLDAKYGILTNDNLKIYLIDSNNSIISETIAISDSYDDNRTWQYCDSNWTFTTGTKNSENNCQLTSTENQTNHNQQNQTSTQNNLSSAKISVKLDGEEEFENNKEYEAEVFFYNLEDEDYDIKVFMTFENNDSIISETYNDNTSDWKSSNYYLNKVVSGAGNKSENFILRLNNNFKDYYGDVILRVRIRLGEKIIADDDKTITIVKTEQEQIVSQASIIENKTELKQEQENIIRLNPQGIKSQEVWKSKLQYIKEYSIYAFTLFTMIIAIIVILRYRKS